MKQEIVTGGDALIERARSSIDRRYHAVEVSFQVEGGTPALMGVVTSTRLLELLREALSRERIDAECKVEVRTGEEGGPGMWTGNAAVVGLHERPDYRSALLTQIVLGEKLHTIARSERWHLVRAPDGYLGWTHESGLTAGARRESEREAVVVGALSALVRRRPSVESEPLREVLYDSHLIFLSSEDGWTEVCLPDGEKGWVPDDALRPVTGDGTTRTPEKIVQEAKRMLGVPYLWGGNSTKGFDCSGLIQRVFHYCGVSMPRDADLQRNAAAHLPEESVPAPGDLLFFGADSVDHVALSLGDSAFLHTSGWVRIESLDPASAFCRADLAARYRGAGRVPPS